MAFITPNYFPESAYRNPFVLPGSNAKLFFWDHF
ncbi:hypothetical protein YPH_1171 [Yersinia pestis biovar Orientalis str. PEXU2]|nr:hypothetical protein YP516_0867 [Yersinia pestis Nepal516]EEO85320.1 hypothetical protein YPH_1171 [Yersinia pestis biovar Orientalis str. PEXU2]EEO88496.1 hypothetical protein YPS_4217 [Yersinia pestis Pestoides A]